jgi:hypothetical protein
MNERIRQFMREQQTQALIDRLRQEREYQQKNLAEKKAEEKRLNFNRINTERIMRDSGVLSGLRKIEKELLVGRRLKHNLIYEPEERKAILVWGEKYSIQDGKLFLSDFEFDAVGITVHVISSDNALSISYEGHCERFDEKTWSQHHDLVGEALAQAYLNPSKFFPCLPSGTGPPG